jgi:hypothetical protein
MASMAGATRIDGCPGVTLGPQKTPADKTAFASNEPQEESVPPRHGILSPPPLFPIRGVRGERRG